MISLNIIRDRNPPTRQIQTAINSANTTKLCLSPILIINEENYYGASAIFHPAVQEKLKELFPDGYWLIPSSRHEFLAVPKYDDPQLLQGLTELNADVNKNVLNSDDFLAYGILELKNGTLVPAKLPEYKIWL